MSKSAYVFAQSDQKRPRSSDGSLALHYENTPIQIYRKFYHQKTASFQIKNLIFFYIFLLKT